MMQQQLVEEITTLQGVKQIISLTPNDDYLANFLGTYTCQVDGCDCPDVILVMTSMFKYMRTYGCKMAPAQVVPFCIKMITHTKPVTHTYQVLVNLISTAIKCGETLVVAGLITQNVVWLYDRGQLSENILEMVCEYGGAGVSDVICKILTERHAIVGMLENVTWTHIHKAAYERLTSRTPLHVTMVVFADIIRLEHTVTETYIHEWDTTIRGYIMKHVRAYKETLHSTRDNGQSMRDSDRAHEQQSRIKSEHDRAHEHKSRIKSEHDRAHEHRSKSKSRSRSRSRSKSESKSKSKSESKSESKSKSKSKPEQDKKRSRECDDDHTHDSKRKPTDQKKESREEDIVTARMSVQSLLTDQTMAIVKDEPTHTLDDIDDTAPELA